MTDLDIRLSPEGTAAQQFSDLSGNLRWVYLAEDWDTGLRLQLCTDDEVAAWPRLRPCGHNEVPDGPRLWVDI